MYTGSESATIYKNVKVAGNLQVGAIKAEKAEITGELQTGAINVKTAKIAGELQADSITVGGQSLISLVISLRDAVLGPDGTILK